MGKPRFQYFSQQVSRIFKKVKVFELEIENQMVATSLRSEIFLRIKLVGVEDNIFYYYHIIVGILYSEYEMILIIFFSVKC